MASLAQSPQFILFGDSLTEYSFDEDTEGFGWFLQQQYKDQVHVRDEGKGGYTSTNLLPEFDRVIDSTTAPNAPQTLLFTIFVGANDACFDIEEECVPLPKYEANIRKFIETILAQHNMAETKVVLVTPPPINIWSPETHGEIIDDMEDLNKEERKLKSYKTYKSKQRYAKRVMEIAEDYKETGRVIGINFWKDLVNARLEEIKMDYDDDNLPGSGLYGVEDFGEGYFTDGLHLEKKGYNVLSQSLYRKMLATWPQLAPGAL